MREWLGGCPAAGQGQPATTGLAMLGLFNAVYTMLSLTSLAVKICPGIVYQQNAFLLCNNAITNTTF